MPAVCVGLKAHMGWVNAVAVRLRGAEPAPVHACRVELLAGAPAEVGEPYHVAGGWNALERVARPADPAAVIRRGRAAQVTAARRQLAAYRDRLAAAGWSWDRAVVLVGRGRLGSLEHTLASHAQIHVAEGEAIRAATRAALDALGVPWVDQDEKRIAAAAGKALGAADPDGRMKQLRPDGAAAWTREERLVALGAWLNRSR